MSKSELFFKATKARGLSLQSNFLNSNNLSTTVLSSHSYVAVFSNCFAI